MQPLISVIVPIYNVEKYLNKCVESIVNQTYNNLEIILVDDGSPDSCPQICDKWAEKDSRIKVIHRENGGVSSARNAGLDAAEGEIISFIDPDDYICLNTYERICTEISLNDFDVVICNMFREGIDDENLLHERAVFGSDVLTEYLGENFCQPGVPNKFYKKSVIGDLRFDQSLSIGEDYMFNYYVFSKAKSAIFIDDALYCYFYREDSAVNSLSEKWVTRWKNKKFILETQSLSDKNYSVLLSRYAAELCRILRELFIFNDKKLIEDYFYVVVDEIKLYYNRFLNEGNNSKLVRFYLKLINKSPNLFKLLYRFVVFCRKGRR